MSGPPPRPPDDVVSVPSLSVTDTSIYVTHCKFNISSTVLRTPEQSVTSSNILLLYVSASLRSPQIPALYDYIVGLFVTC